MKIGVLGCNGSIGKRHHSNIKITGHEAYGYDECWGVDNAARNFMIEECDAIIVATPSQRHSKDLMDAINAHKHVLVEKPFGYDCPPFVDGYIGISREARPSLIIATGFNCRYHPCVKSAKEILARGDLGNIQAASFSVNQLSTKEPYLRDGVIRNWLSHEIDIAHHLLGNGEVISCTAEDQREADILMKFDSVADRVYIHGDYITSPQQRFFWIEGDKGTIHANMETATLYFNRRNVEICEAGHVAGFWDHTYLSEMQDFIKSIETGSHIAPLATAEDGIRTTYSVMEARYKAGLEKVQYTKPEGSCVP